MIRYLSNWKNAHQLEIVLFIIIVIIIGVSVARRKLSNLQFGSCVIITSFLYIVSIFYVTVFSREPNKEQAYNNDLFWSYKLALDNKGYMEEIGLNILLFVPLGILISSMIKKRKTYLYVALIIIAGMLSISIELLQYNLKCGFSEMDDIVSNVLGTILGIVLWKIMWMFCRFINKRS